MAPELLTYELASVPLRKSHRYPAQARQIASALEAVLNLDISLVSVLATDPAGASPGTEAERLRRFIYSVKFICGLQTTAPNPAVAPSEPPVKPGNYATAVNVHNFHSSVDVTFKKKAVIANPESQPKGPISGLVADVLNPNQAEEVDCDDIVRLLGASLPPGTSFIKGFVEIQSNFQLSVTVADLFEPGAAQVQQDRRAAARGRAAARIHGSMTLNH